ncbi:CBS domain-containing protein [Streptomyces acidiscabies]|uniref:CBS domain-containing protein n=1 Tax=Streptomyces acidiscabies TaxID=42234 RepID=A0AAP6BME8_9ACTN|nr:CBS domain-containing protein [Streptomyces acidiscabies]MBP5937263.1 CBS domain-containing protein [Streptomyces sp. LBUM 1476]MBZ3914679.1 CBS domain-containing protein [Streptomyces acidiscabies]MDX2967238.1 CBS domain-containing protein [Streptomyces acidiscabies]MDX3020593.1 CBS domain-containing protein [Streptomyces acidiscabies]MDX3795800.1 CBS domain-containing protein [Streptomyces acidiscabies]
MIDSTLGKGEDESLGRASYLIEGRRVLVSDLVNAGLLTPGAQLTFWRKRSGEAHRARVTEDGRIELSDGQRFKSPSAAAAAATGRGPHDGWTAWALDDGTLLDVLRQKLLDTVAELPSSGNVAAEGSAARHVRLKNARRQADADTPITLTVRDLLGWWGASRRGYLVTEQVAAELANHGLSTVPDFEAVGIDDRVALTGPSGDTEDGEDTEEETAEQEPVAGQEPRATGTSGPTTTSGGQEDEDEPVQGQTVGNLPSALKGVVSVPSSASFEEAFTKMRLNGYSQLPVLNGPRNLRGAVTWESIARARYADAAAPFADAIVDAHAVSYAEHLIDVLPDLERFGFLLVKDQMNQIAGIITVADVAAEYGATARPFLLIGDLDRQLRRVISRTLELTEVITLCDPDGLRKLTAFDQLSFGDYQQVLSNQKQWDRLDWPLDRKAFTARLDELREIRNELMHFNDKDKAGDSAIPMLRNMIELLREHGG